MTDLERALAEIELLREENRLLRQKLDHVIRQLYGAKSEKLDPAQLDLFGDLDGPGKPEATAPPEDDGAVEALMATAPPCRPRLVKQRKPRLPESLPVEEIVLEPEPVKACPEAWRRIGEEVSEELDYEPGRFLRRRLVRPKYVRIAKPEAAPIVAKLPERLLERGILAPGLLAHIVISKYADHLPLYRQEQIYLQRHGVGLSRQTMANGVALVAEWLQPVVEAMKLEQFAHGYVQIDETPIKYLAPGQGKAAQGYLWTSHRPGGDTVYHWHPGRGSDRLASIIPNDFVGTIQCDAFGAYRTHARGHEGIHLAGCWAHARRKFHEAFVQGESKQRAAWILRQISHLYDVERQLREKRAGPRLREAERQGRSRPVLERIHRALQRFQKSRRHLPKSLMGKAMGYTLGQWQMLKVFVGDGRIEIDNNLVENAIRPTAVGKKNWLFIGDKDAGWRSAVIYSVITSCRSRGIDPHAYIKDVLTRLPTMTNRQVAEVTPTAWAMQSESLVAAERRSA
jgi:transposase